MTNSAAYEQWLRANQDKRGTPDYVTVLQAFEVALRREAGAAAPAPTAKPESGFLPALRAGVTELGGGLSALLGRAGLKDEAAAQAEYDAAQKRAREIFAPTEAGWTEAPGTKFLELLGGSLPYMAAPLAAGAAAATLPVTGPAALATTLGAAGLTSAAQFTATNLSRQMEEGKKLAETDLGSAALAAIPQAALDTLSMRLIPGIGRIFGQAGIKVTAETAKEIAEQGLKKTLIDYTAATGKTMGAEGLTEAAQQVLERAQAGLSLTDPKARAEYFESFLGGAILSGTLAVPGRYYERSKAQGEARTLLEGQEAEQRKAAREAAEAEKKTPEYLLNLEARYKAAVAKKAELDEAAKKPAPGADPATMVAYRNAVRARDDFAKTEMSAVADEYEGRKKEIDQLKERRRVEGMTPFDYLMEQAQEVPVMKRKLPFTVEDTEIFPTIAPVAPEAAYAQKQMAIAKQQDLGAFEAKDFVQYLLQDPAMAQRLVEAKTPIPEVSKKESNAILGGLKLQLQEQAKERAKQERTATQAELQQRQEDLKAQQPEEKADPLAMWKASVEQTEDQATEELLRLNFEMLRPTGPRTPEVAQPSAAIGQIQQLLSGEDVTYRGETAPPPARELRRVPAEGLTLFGESKAAAEAAPAKTPEVPLLRERIARLLLNPDLSDEAYTLLRRADDLLPEVETRIETVRERKGPEGTIRDVAQTAGLLELLDKQVALIEQGQEGIPTTGRTLEREVRPVPVGARRGAAADIVAPTVATQDDVKLARQRSFAELVAQGFSPGEAAKRAFQIGKPTRKAQEVPFERAAVPALPPEPGQAVDVRRRFAGRITPMQPRVAQPAAPGPEAAQQPGRRLAPVPRVGTLRGLRDKTLTYQAELEPLLQLQERVRAEEAGQLPLFPEREEERGAIEATPAAFQTRLAQLKAAKQKNADELLSKEAQVQPLEEEIKQLEATLNVLQQKQKAFENAQFILSNNSLLLKELDIKEAGTEKLRGGMGALTFTEANLQYAANALDRQRVLLTNYITRLQKEKEQAGNLRTDDVKEIGALLTRRAEDEARIQNNILASAEEIGRINALEQDIYNRQFPNIDAAKENARLRMGELHKRFGEASAWADGINALRKKVQRQYDVAQETQRRFTADPELSQLVSELGRQLIDIDNRLARNTALMDKIKAQIDVGVAEANLQKLKAEASPEAIANVQKQIVDARSKLNNIRAEVAKTTTKKETKTENEVAQAVEEKNYAATLSTHQRMLEAMQLRTKTGTIVPALSYVQRLARDNPQAKFSVQEKDLIGKDPREVLDGLRSRVTVVERAVKAAVANSRGAEFRAEKELINKYQRLISEYEAADTSLERAQIEPELSATLKEYNAALNTVLGRRVVWKGQAAQTAELLSLYEKIAYLENMLNYGLEPSVTKRYQPETPEEAAKREEEVAAIFASQREAQEGAGATTGEALTRSQAAKRRKPQKTAYSGRGVGPEELSKKDAEDLLIAQNKQSEGQPLTKRDTALLKAQAARDARARENVVIKEKAAKNAVLRSAFEKKERKEALTPLEQFFYDEAMSEGVTTVEEISLEEAEAERTRATRGRPTEETVDEAVAEQLAETFEERAGFEQAEKFSRGPTANPSTTDSVRTELKKTFPDLGRVQLYDSVDALIAANPQYKGKIPADARGFVDSAGNKAFLIAENINKGDALSVLLHEVGAHVGLKSMLGDAQYSALVNAVKSWEKRNDGSKEAQVAKAARARVEAAETPAGQVNDELLAYAIEEAVNAGVKPMETKGPLGQWLSRVAALFRRALEKFGLPPKTLDAQGIVDMAFGAAKMEMGREAAAPEVRGRGELLFTKDAKTKVIDTRAIGTFGPIKNTTAVLWTDGESVMLQLYDQDLINEGVKPSKAQVETIELEIKDKGKIAALHTYGVLPSASATLSKYKAQLEHVKPEGVKKDPYYKFKPGAFSVTELRKLFRVVRDQTVELGMFDNVEKVEIRRATGATAGMPSRFIEREDALKFSRNLPTAARVANQLVGKEKGVIDKIRDNFLGIGGRAQFIDKLFPTEAALQRAGADPTKAMQAMYYLRMYDQRMHFTSQAITDGVPERVEKTRRDGTKEFLIEAKPGANLQQAFDILKRKDVVKEAGSADAANKLVTLYMAAIRGERVGYETLNFGRVWAQGEIKRIENELKSPKLSAEQRTVLTKRMNRLESRLDSMPTPEDIKAAKAEIDANPVLRDAFSEVRDIYNQYNRDLINFNVQTGALSKEQANKLLQENDYIPYYRMRDGVAELIIGKETPIRIGNLKDSPHLQELVGGDEPIMDFITSSVQNTSMLIDMATHNLAMKNLMFEFKDLGLATVGKVKGGNAPAGAVTFKLDGVEHFGVVDTEALGISSDLLVKGLAGIPTMFPAFVRVMGMPARFLRRMIVASPLYMARQLFRDSLAASIASGSNTVPVLSALKQIGKAGALERRGVTGGQVFTGMPEDMSRMIKQMQAGKISVANGLAYLEGKAAQVDALTRRAQYDDYIKRGLSEMEATYMALESMNFSRRGLSPSIHMASTLIPFFNAQIQGLDVLYRSFRGQMPMNERLGIRKKLIERGALLFLLSFAYATAMQDDEAYKNAKPDEKYGNWFVSLPGVEQPIRLPIPFELGYVFKALPEAIVNTLANEEGGEEALKALKHIVQQMIPGGSSYMIPAAVKPVLEALAFEKSLYTGRDIESAREQAVEPGYRARESTTELAKAVGQMTGFSPIKLEFLISGYTGQMGMALISALSAPFPGTGEGPAPATKRPSDLPLVGTLFQPKDASGIIDLVYERMNKVRQVQETYKRLIADNKPEQAKRYAEEKADELALASVAGAFREQMGQITEFERQVRASTLAPDRKRAELDRARQAKINLARAVQGLSGRTAPQAARP